ncbi:MAG: hypothetical protein WCO76_01595 [Planctomycetota bacterium]
MSTFPIRFTTSTCVIALGSFAILTLGGAAAQAQPARSTFSAGRTGGGGGSAELPFSNSTYRRPTVSPYMQLQQQGYNPMQNQNIYQTMVQPQVQQQQQQVEQQTQRRQMSKLQNQVQQIGRDTSGRQIDESIRATGHRATYMNYSHYYQ